MAWAPASGRLLGPGSHGPPVSRSTVRPPRPDRWPHYGKPGADLLRLSRLEKGCPSWRPTGLAADPYGLAIPAGPSSAAAAGRRRSKRASSQAPTAASAVTRSATSSVEGRGASAFRYAVSKRSEEPATAAGSPDRCTSASIALPAYGLSIMLSIVAATARHPHRENRLRPNACRSASHPAMSESSSDWSSRHAPQRRNIARAGWVIWGQLCSNESGGSAASVATTSEFKVTDPSRCTAAASPANHFAYSSSTAVRANTSARSGPGRDPGNVKRMFPLHARSISDQAAPRG